MSEGVELLLKELRLPAFKRNYEALWDQASDQNWSHVDYLTALCEKELADRYERRVQKWTREARLPHGKTFASLQYNAMNKPARTLLKRLEQNDDWWRRAENVLLIGPSGLGKTHIAAAIGHQLIEHQVRCKLFPAMALVQQLQQAKRDLELMKAMTQLDKYRVIILDDVGYVKKTDAETQVLFEFIAHRYESASLIITANQPFSEWDHIFPDNIMTVAAIDRLIHHATIISLEGMSYRKKESRRKK